MTSDFNKKIFIAGHNGMLGSTMLKMFKKKGFTNIITKNKNVLNLTNQQDVNIFFQKNNIDEVYIAAAMVGGIMANFNMPAHFIYNNVLIAANIINAAKENKVKKLMFIGSSCIYPKFTKQPIHEDQLLDGKLERTNEAYAIAKIAGLKMCEYYNKQFNTDFRSVMLTNLYGPGDNYDPVNSHVIPGLICKIYDAKLSKKAEIKIWGSGQVKREFLYVDDAARAIIKVMNIKKLVLNKTFKGSNTHINIGIGKDYKISEVVEIISSVIGYKGKIIYDKSYPDGTPRKILNSNKMRDLGWLPTVSLEKGIKKTFTAFKKTQ